jgi:transcription-repair coupling factor (superfamily II helicase)
MEPLRELSGFAEMTKQAKEPGVVTISGCIDAQKPHIIYACGNDRKNKIIVTFHEQKAKELYEDYLFFDPNAVYYPAKDVLFYQADIRGNLLTAQRIGALKAIREQESVTLITTFDALMNTMAPPANIWDSILNIRPQDALDLEKVTSQLVRMGYEKEYQVENSGQFAVRGGILDIFPLTEELPVRIELWGDEVDTIRSFDVESQKSIDPLEEIAIYPACELVLSEEQKNRGISAVLEEAENVSEKLRKEMKSLSYESPFTGAGGAVGRTVHVCRSGCISLLFHKGTDGAARLFFQGGYDHLLG